MSKKIFFSLFLLVAVFGFWTCGDDDNNGNPCSVTWASDLANEINAVTVAAQAYAANPTTATCNSYKQAMQAYIDALEPYGNCPGLTGQDKTDWQNAVDNAQSELNNLQC